MVFLCCCQLLRAQQVKDSSKTMGLRNMLKIKISSDLGLEWEKRITPNSSISLFGGYNFGLQSDDYTDKNTTVIKSPDLFAEYRNYYDLKRRIAREKRTHNNSADFFFGRIETVFAVKGQNNFNLLAMQGWGIQRSISKWIMIGFHLGIIEHFYFDKPVTGGFNNIKLEPLRSFSVSLVF